MLELVVCVLQVFGTVCFAGPELLLGLPNVWRGWAIGIEEVAYFWFAFAVCMPLWIVVPMYLGKKAWSRCDQALMKAEKKSV